MNKISLALFAGILVGCVTAAVVQPYIVPPAHAKVADRWEYQCFM